MRLTILAAARTLPACTATQLYDLEAKRVAWICAHPRVVEASSRLQIEGAQKIKDPNIRAAVIARAEGDLGVVANCK